jgi:DNA-binding XRE family transcriptional regulator
MAAKDGVTWWLCPNEPRCPHGAVLHDIEEDGDPSPTCCAEGCLCGQRMRSADDVDDRPTLAELQRDEHEPGPLPRLRWRRPRMEGLRQPSGQSAGGGVMNSGPTGVIDNLHAERLRQQLTQRTVAARIGISQSCLCRWEIRETDPPLKMVYSWARVLGVSLELVLDGVVL